jgi:uncharacterized protein (TIGR03437 family)
MRWLLLIALAAAAPLAAQQGCSYGLSQTAFIFAGAATPAQPLSATVTVTATAGCTWTYSTTSPWIQISPITGTGPGSIYFSLLPNNTPAMLQGTIAFSAPGTSGTTITIIEMSATCAYAVSPTAIEIPVGGGSGAMQVTTGCSWLAGTNQSWVTATLDSANLYAGNTNYGNGAVDYTVSANTCVASRTASISVGTGQPGTPPGLTITQDGSPNNLTLSQTTLATSSAATTGRITVTTGDGCAWTAYSDSSWLQLTSNTSGSGLSSFPYSVLANTGPARTGAIHVGTQTFTVSQQAVPPPAMTITSVLNAANYTSGVVSPGEIIDIFGSNLGPAQGVPYQLSGQSIPKTLGGVQVLFGNTAAVLLYASATQINAIVPYSVAGTASTAVTVTYQSQVSNTVTIPVQAATPGIFSQDQSGNGPGAILNQDYSINASLSPATVGSVIQIFATGGGVTSPAVADGVLAPSAEPLPRLTGTPISVTIGGFPAQVQYAGDAPGLVAGVTQVNAVVPAGVAPGLSVPVVLQVGNWQSQAGITITVH